MISKIHFIFSYFALRMLTVFSNTQKGNVKNKSILFLETFPIENAGYQYRSKKWAEIFNKENLKTEVWTIFEDKKEWEDLLYNSPQKFLRKAMWIRYRQIKKSKAFSKVIVRRELLQYNDYGNLFMEKFLLKLHPDAILDFDDDISAAKNEPKPITSLFGKLLKEDGSKFTNSLSLYSNFIPGSNYLNDLILKKRGNSNFKSCVIPTCVDYDKYAPKQYNIKEGDPIKFGWIGSNGNLPLLESIIPALNKVSQYHSIELIVIAGKEFKPKAKFPIINIAWSLDTEIENIKKIDIGLMPLDDSVRARGKCGFKLIQYMGLGIISIASNITINKEILNYNQQLLVQDKNWEKTISNFLIYNKDYPEIGKLALEQIKNNYTYSSNVRRYFDFLAKK